MKLTDIIGKKIAVHCKTQEEWDKVTEICGYDWNYDCTKWFVYGDKTCINIAREGFGTADIAYNSTYGYTIIPASQFIASNTTPSKPQTFCIKSEDPDLLKLVWGKMEKMGYVAIHLLHNLQKERTWEYLCQDARKETAHNRKELFSRIYVSGTAKHDADLTFTLPADYNAALQHAHDAINSEWWDRDKKQPTVEELYPIGSKFVVTKQNSFYTGKVLIVEEYRTYGTSTTCDVWDKEHNTVWKLHQIRPATPEEIEAATKKDGVNMAMIAHHLAAMQNTLDEVVKEMTRLQNFIK